MKKFIQKLFFIPLFTLLFFSLWEMGIDFFHTPAYLLPSPFEITALIKKEYAYFFWHGQITFLEAICGLLLAFIMSFSFSLILIYCGKVAERTFIPVIVALQAIPMVAMAPLFVFWFGIGLSSKIILVAILCWFPLVMNTTKGLVLIDPDRLALMHTFQATPWQILYYLRLPSSIPFLFSGLKIAAGLSIIGAIVAEYSGANIGLGYIITQSSYRLDTLRLFGSLFFASFESLFLYGIFCAAESSLFQKYFIKSG